MRILLFAWMVLACSGLQIGPPGSPSGGPHCFQESGRPDACYPTDSERAAAQARRAAEIEATQRQQQIPSQGNAGESSQQRYWREEEERKAAEAKAPEEVWAERERQRKAALDAQATRAAELNRLAADPTVAGAAVSAIICSIEAEMAELRAELDKEKRASALSGAVNLRARHDIAADIVADTDEIKVWRASLQRVGAKQLACKDVAGIVACRNRIEQCDEASRDPAEVWAKEQATLWGSEKERPQR